MSAFPSRFFLNVDLDLQSDEDLTPLVQAFEPFAFSLERAPGRASFELNEPAEPTSPATVISEFVRLVNGLPSSARLVWDRAERRVFDIGLQSRRHPFSETYSLDADLLRAAADVGADVAITVYALADDARTLGRRKQ